MATGGIKKTSGRLRIIVQVFFFILIALISINHTLIRSGRSGIPLLSSASIHSLCPFGGVVSIYQYLDTGTAVRQVHQSAFVLMWIGFALALVLGPVFCGWVCPMGTIQEFVGKLGKRIFKKYNRFIPYKVDRVLRYLRYLVLAWVVYMTAASATLIFANYDPYFTLFHLWSGEVAISGIIILTLVLLASLFVERPFCKYACPYGALIGVFNLFRIFKIKRNSDTCIECKACDQACPMNIPVSTSRVVRDHQCISCMKCTSGERCPVENTVEMMTGKFTVMEAKKEE